MTGDDYAAVAATAAADGVFVLDDEDRVVFANEAIRTALDGIDPTDTPLGLLPETTPLTEDTVADVATAVTEARLGVGPVTVSIETELDGETRRVGECRLRSAAEPLGTVVGVVRDVTRKHEHQEVVRSLHRVSRQLYDAESREAVCSVAVHAATQVLDLPFSGVWLLDEERDRLEPVAASAAAHDRLGGLPRFQRGEGLVWSAFTAGESRLYDDLRTVEGVYNVGTEIRSELIVPVGSHGVLMAGSMSVGALDETDRDLAELLAANTAAVLDRQERDARLSERDHSIRHQTDRLAMLDSMLAEGLLPMLAPALGSLPEDRQSDAYRYVDGVTELVADGLSLGPLTDVKLSTAAHEAVASLDTDRVRVVLDGDAAVRCDEARLTALFEWFAESALARVPDADAEVRSPWSRDRHWTDGGQPTATLRVNLLEGDGGFRLADDVPVDETGLPGPAEPAGVGHAVALGIASAHGWDTSVDVDETGRRLSISNVRTLSRVD